MSPDLREMKRALRRRMIERRARLEENERARASARLCEQLRPQPLWKECRSLLSFYPMAAEPDVRPLLEEALAAGKSLALPRFDPARGGYEAFAVSALEKLHPGHFGIPEPGPSSPRIELNALDFFLVPGVAYDRNGRRLGHGKGYFDRLLAQVPGHKCGVAFEWQVVAQVPVEPHDVCVDSLLTPTRWFRCHTGRAVV
jgi:5-formyltetrahydrofolate cyclo-ligase